MKVETAKNVVVACVVLHNICVRSGDITPPDDLLLTAGRQVFEDIPAMHCNAQPALAATAARSAVINDYFNH